MQLAINRERLQQRLHTLTQIGRQEDAGIYRMAFSPGDMQAREWFGNEIKEAGLALQVDPAANISATWNPAKSDKTVLMGSHLDSVPGAGHLDGALGVMVALECVQCLKEANIALDYAVEAIAFTDEEGRFGGMIGSQAIAGKLTPAMIRQAKDLDGISLESAMQECGFDPQRILQAERSPKSLRAFLELHIEQGPVLDRMHIPVGVVHGITGLFKWQVELIGESNHAGTTPMSMRKDAFQGLAEFSGQLQRLLEEHGTQQSRATVGQVHLTPGAANVIPGRVEFSLEVRDTDAEVLAALALACRRTLAAIAQRRGLMMNYQVLSELTPVQCDPAVVQLIEQQARRLSLPYHVMPSGAAHDCQMLADVTPSGMIFVPSKDGRSHSPDEWTSMDDIEQGANLALNVLQALATEV